MGFWNLFGKKKEQSISDIVEAEAVKQILAAATDKNAQAVQMEAPAPVSDEELLRLYISHFSPLPVLTADHDSSEYKAFSAVIDKAKQEMLDAPMIYKLATGRECEDFRVLTENADAEQTRELIFGLIYTVGAYAVFKDAEYCVDFAEVIPNCAALYLFLNAPKFVASRPQVIDAGKGTNTAALQKAMDTLSVLDENWNYRIH